MTSRPNKKLHLPLRNVTNSLNCRSMSYSGDSGFSNLTNSPMSNLAYNLSELSTGRCTPRRRLSLSSLDTPPTDCDKGSLENPKSLESGFSSESPNLIDSPTLESFSAKRYTASLHPDIPLEAFSLKKKTIAFRRISSQPLPTLRLDSPTDFHDDDSENEENTDGKTDLFADDAASQDSGLGLEHDRKLSITSSDDCASSTCSSPSPSERLPSLEDVWHSMSGSSFKAPRGKPPKRTRSMLEQRQYSEDTCSPLKYSPVKSYSEERHAFSGFSKALFVSSPAKETRLKLKSQCSSDDGFLELFDIEDVNSELPKKNYGPQQVSSLMNATILHQVNHKESDDIVHELEAFQSKFIRKGSLVPVDSQDNTPSSRPVVSRRAFLQRSQSVDYAQPRMSFKRSEPPQDGTTPIQSKKFRAEDATSTTDENFSGKGKRPVPSFLPARRLQRCHSETEAMIKSAVSRMFSEPDLIGDSSRPYCLPTIKGKHQDLKSITPETLSRVLANEFEDEIEEFHILDCRYPYEFDGGHIQTAKNIYTEPEVRKYLDSPMAVKDPSKRIVLIFHCEFSSERAPKLYRFLRKKDREQNKDCYPYLHYPEIYLLEGGYKNFFQEFSHLCEPQKYKQMLDKDHSEDLRRFRAKCKSWSEDRAQARGGLRPLQF